MVLGGAVGEDGIAGGALGIGRLHGYFHPIRDGLAHPSNTLDPTQPLATAHSYRLFRDPATTIARNIANSVISESSKQVKSLEGKNSPVQVVMMTPADLSQAKKAPSPAKYIIAGLLAGIILGYAIALIRHLADRRIHTTDDITDRIEKPILATIPTSSTIETLSTDLTDDFKAAEAIRKLRTNLRYAMIDNTSKVILVTSSVMGGGKVISGGESSQGDGPRRRRRHPHRC